MKIKRSMISTQALIGLHDIGKSNLDSLDEFQSVSAPVCPNTNERMPSLSNTTSRKHSKYVLS